MKRSLHTLILLLSVIFVGGLVAIDTTSALEFQTDPSGGASNNPVTLKFRFGETLTITTGGAITITGLVPGASDISASNYVVTVNTNNVTGYTLSATVGCETGTSCYDSKNLSDGTNNFTMLNSTGALTAGTWGVSLDSNATKASNFQTLAKWDDISPTTINQTTDATGTAATGYQGTNNTTVRIGAYAASTQATGTYTNVINFIAVTNMSTADSIYMQDQTASSMAQLLPYVGYTTVLTDRRDGTKYTVGKLPDGNYWMLDNLALDPTAVSLSDLQGTTTYPNTNATNTSLEYLKGVQSRDPNNDSNGNYATAGVSSNWNSSYSYSVPLIDVTSKNVIPSGAITGSKGQNKVGGYYNFCAASAGSYCYGNGTSAGTTVGNATEDICPSGWKIPAATSSGDYQTLTTTITGVASNSYSGDQAIAIKQALSLTLSGGFVNGIVSNQGDSGAIWSSTGVVGASSAYRLAVDTTTVDTTGTGLHRGLSVRCIFKTN